MMDSMTDKELDGLVAIDKTRCLRIAQGAGANPRELLFLLGEHKRFSKMVERMGKMTQSMEDPNIVSLIVSFSLHPVVMYHAHRNESVTCNLACMWCIVLLF